MASAPWTTLMTLGQQGEDVVEDADVGEWDVRDGSGDPNFWLIILLGLK